MCVIMLRDDGVVTLMMKMEMVVSVECDDGDCDSEW